MVVDIVAQAAKLESQETNHPPNSQKARQTLLVVWNLLQEMCDAWTPVK